MAVRSVFYSRLTAATLCLVAGWLGETHPLLAQLASESHPQETSSPAEPAGSVAIDDPAETPAISTGELRAEDAKPGSGYLGVVADDREDYGQGVRVLAVRPGGPAEKARFQAGDLIVAVGDVRVRGLAAMADTLRPHAPGNTLTLDVLRDRRLLTLTVTLGRAPTKASEGSSATTLAPVPDAIADADTSETVPRGPVIEPRPAPGNAPPTNPPYETQIEQLLQRIEQLERRVGELERALSEKIENRH